MKFLRTFPTTFLLKKVSGNCDRFSSEMKYRRCSSESPFCRRDWSEMSDNQTESDTEDIFHFHSPSVLWWNNSLNSMYENILQRIVLVKGSYGKYFNENFLPYMLVQIVFSKVLSLILFCDNMQRNESE